MPEVNQPETAEPQPDAPSGAALAAPPPSKFSNILVGPEGIRAGWSIILFLALFGTLLLATGFMSYRIQKLVHRHPASAAPATSQPLPATRPNAGLSAGYVFSNEAVPFVSVLVATWLMGKIERRPASAYGFRPRHRTRFFWSGLVSGLVLLTLLVGLLRQAGMLVFDARLLFGGKAWHYGAIWFGNFLLVGLLEESLSRGYLQFTLTRGLRGIYRSLFGETHANALGFWTAALILCFAFGFGHRTNPGESPLGLLSAGLAGFLFCFGLWRTGSLWWAIGFHAAWDWAQSFLYGVPDSGLMVSGHLFATHPVGRPYLSGGLTGPEGSIFLLPIVLAGVLVAVFTLPRTHAGYTPADTAANAAALDLA